MLTLLCKLAAGTYGNLQFMVDTHSFRWKEHVTLTCFLYTYKWWVQFKRTNMYVQGLLLSNDYAKLSRKSNHVLN